MRLTHSLHTMLRLCLIGLVLFPSLVIAQSYYIQMPAQPLTLSLNLLSTRYNVSFVVSNGDIEGIWGNALSGDYDTSSALRALLLDSGFEFHQLDSGIIITPATKSNEYTEIEEIAVTGIRAFLNVSKQVKKHHHIIADVIATHDLASYPDRNLAESLQRIPGIAITREAGEGRQIALRGLNPDFTLVTLNGMPVLANNDSPMDSRVQKQQDRSFDLNLFATELFNQIDILKSYSPEQPTGGLAGIAALSTAHPFDNPGFHWSVTHQIGKNAFTDPLAGRVSGMVSKTFDHWGALFSVTYGERETLEKGANTFRWRNIPAQADLDLSNIDSDVANKWVSGALRIPRGNRYSVWLSDMARLGIGASVEYRAARSTMTLDWLYGELSGERYENHLYPRGDKSTPVIPGVTSVLDAKVNTSNELVFASYKQARVATESRFQSVATTYNQWVMNFEHQFKPNFTGYLLVGNEVSKYAIPTSLKAYMKGVSDVTIDYRSDHFFADINYAEDLSYSNFWQMQELDSEDYRTETQYQTTKLALEYRADDSFTAVAGVDWLGFFSQSSLYAIDNILMNEWDTYDSGIPAGEFSSEGILSVNNSVPINSYSVLKSHPKVNWLSLNTRAVFDAFGVPVSFFDIDPDTYALAYDTPEEHSSVEEKQWSGFVRAIYKNSDWTLDGGLRAIRDRIQIWDNQSLVNQKRYLSHFHVLPSLNLRYRVSNDTLYRFSASRTLGRPSIEDLTRPVGFDDELPVLYGFNSALKPYFSYNFDGTYETYDGSSGMLAISTFVKFLDDYIVPVAQQLSVEDIPELDYSLANIDLDTNTISRVTPQNAETAYLYGVELTLQKETSFEALPHVHFGANFNGSYNQGKVQYYDGRTGEALSVKRLPFLSPWLGNLTLYMEGYDFSARVSATYRDEYLARVDGNRLIDEDETGFNSATYIDAVFAYQLNDQWELRLEATNLSNEREEQYSDSSRRAYNTTYSGRSYYFGVIYRN